MHFIGSRGASTLARRLYSTNSLSLPLFTKPLSGLCRLPPSSIRMPRAYHLIPTFWAAFTARQTYMIHARRFSSFPNYQQGKIPSLLDSKSLRSTSRYDTSPVSFGILAWKGYDPFILPGTRLPCRETAIFESEFDYIEEDVLRICFCPPLKGDFKVIAELPVSGIRRAKKKDTRMTLVMDLDKDLTGTLTARFTPQDKTVTDEASINFDGRQAGGHKHNNDIITL